MKSIAIEELKSIDKLIYTVIYRPLPPTWLPDDGIRL